MKKKKIIIIIIASLCLVGLLIGGHFAFQKKDDGEGEDGDLSIYDIGMTTEYEDCFGLESGNGKTAHVLLLIGQSNCTGCSITSYLKNQTDDETFARYQNGYENIKINLNIDNHRTSTKGEFKNVDLLCGSYDEEFGPEVGLADTLSKALPDELFIVLKFSMSGYSLNYHWLRTGERGEIYNANLKFATKSLEYIKSCGYQVSLDAVLWMQGESDTSDYKTSRYYDNQVAFISYLREDFALYTGERGLYFIDAGISDSPYCLPGYPGINEAKEKISHLDEKNIYFPTIENGLTTLNEPYEEPDLGHYDALSMIKLGELFAEAVINIYK